MKNVAILNNAGGGRSILARRLAEFAKLSLYVIDMIQFRPIPSTKSSCFDHEGLTDQREPTLNAALVSQLSLPRSGAGGGT
jgi:hypothetical protein